MIYIVKVRKKASFFKHIIGWGHKGHVRTSDSLHTDKNSGGISATIMWRKSGAKSSKMFNSGLEIFVWRGGPGG